MANPRKPSRLLRWVLWGAASGVLFLLFCWSILSMMIRSHAIPDELKKTPAALAALELSLDPRGAEAHRPLSDRRRWDSVDPPKTFEDYVRFRLESNPNDEGAKLYLELERQFDSEKIYAQWRLFFAPESGTAWQPGDSLNDAQRKWLASHGDWIDKLRRMIAAGGPPMPADADRSPDDIIKRMRFPGPNYSFFSASGEILVVESARLRQADDWAAAAELLLASYALGQEPIDQGMMGHLLFASARLRSDEALLAWLEIDPPGGSILNRVQTALDASRDVDRRRVRIAADILADARMAGIYQFNQPIAKWIAGWDAMLEAFDPPPPPGSFDYLKELHADPLKTIDLTFRVVRSKARADEELREFDSFALKLLRRMQGPYSGMEFDELSDEGMKMSLEYSPFVRIMPNFDEYVTRVVSAEAGTNLNRTALRLLQGEKPAPDIAPDPNSDAWLDSPCRDPFTEAPLRIEDETSSTLIYSLGPDLKDQSGTIAYDPTNGTISEGDLAIRIPRR